MAVEAGATIRQRGSRWLRQARGRSAGSPDAPARPGLTPRFLLGVACCVALAMIWRAAQRYPTGIFDFFPLYYGAKAWLLGGNAYDLRQVVPFELQSSGLFTGGNAYPLPAVLLALPFSLLSPTAAGTLWTGLLVAGILLALRLASLSPWWAVALPVVDGIRLEQYTVLVIIAQIVALWAWRTRRPWVLALCCALILTKPNQGLLFCVAVVCLARNWRQMAVVQAVWWGGTLLLDPGWVGEWLPVVGHYSTLSHHAVLWGLALFAIPFLAMRDWLGAATILQFLVLPFPLSSTYAAGAVPLTVLDDRRGHWLAAWSYCWILFAPLFGAAWAVALAVLLPATVLAMRRHFHWSVGRRVGAAPAIVAAATDHA